MLINHILDFYGIVYKCTHKATKEERVIKFMSKLDLNEEEFAQLEKEISIMSKLVRG